MKLGLEGFKSGVGSRWSEELGGWGRSGWSWGRRSLGRRVGLGSGRSKGLGTGVGFGKLGVGSGGVGGLGLGKLGSGELGSEGTWNQKSRDQGG